MNVLVAPDSFKECLDAFAVAEAIASGLRRGAKTPMTVVQRPLADGGEGLLEVLRNALRGDLIPCTATGPLGAPAEAILGLFDQGDTAVIEMARAAGLHLVPPPLRNPRVAGTRGVGELIRRALDLGARRIIVGLGGSATNDGGAGMAQALGVSLLDAEGRELPPGGAALSLLDRIDLSGLDPRLKEIETIGACDVVNPLCGPTGASAVYGPQKGASAEDAKVLDDALRHYGRLLSTCTGQDILGMRGGGAAGGLGAGLAAFTGAVLRSGVELVFDAYGDMDACAAQADIIITGEGAVDAQTAQGKVVAGVAALGQRHKTPVFVLTGRIRGDLEALYEAGVAAVLPIAPGPISEKDAIGNASNLLAQSASTLMRCAEAFRRGLASC